MQGYINALYSRDKHERRIGKRLEKILREWVNEYNQTKNIDEMPSQSRDEKAMPSQIMYQVCDTMMHRRRLLSWRKS